jgi:hypothetical protein
VARHRILLASVGAALTLGGGALAASSFSDPSGDQNDAPDITAVDIAETPDGLLSVRVTIANFQTLPADSWINLWFDLDNNTRTGEDGDEANAVYTADGVLDFRRWNGQELARMPTTGMSGSFATGVFTFTAPKAAFGNPGGFGLLVVTAREDSHGEALEQSIIGADFASEHSRLTYVSPGPMTFADPPGDEDAAPDVTAVNVSDSKDGWVTFSLATPNVRTLTPDRAAVIAIDRDRKQSTGDDGAEVSIGWAGGSPRVVLQRWNPVAQEWADDQAPTRARARSADGAVVIEVHRSELGDVARFGFATVTVDFTGPDESTFETEDDLEALDFAPERGFWQYALVNKPPVHLVAGAVSSKPLRPVHGRRFAIRAPISRSDTLARIASGKVTCIVRTGLSGAVRLIPATGRFRNGLAECSVTVPVKSAGNVLYGQMTIRALGASTLAKFTYEVR